MRKGRQRILGILSGMKNRCYNKNSTSYNRYGGRGIKVCEEWRNNPQSFVDWSMSHGYADNLTIDRIDNDGNYEPSNCRWATYKQQANNTSRCHMITYNGETKTIKQWAEMLEIDYETLYIRISKGWPIEKALSEPVRHCLRNRYPEIVCKPGENRDAKVKEYRRRKAGIKEREEYLRESR